MSKIAEFLWPAKKTKLTRPFEREWEREGEEGERAREWRCARER